MTLRRLHRIYFGFDGRPDPYLKYLETWHREMPEYEVITWNAKNLPMENCEFTKMMYALRDHAFLTDYYRWWVLREYGGVYLDADVEIVSGKKLDTIVAELAADQGFDAVIGIDNRDGGWYTAHSVVAVQDSELTRFMCSVYEKLGPVAFWRRKIFYFMAPQLVALYFAMNGHNVDGMGTTPLLDAPIVKCGVKIYPQEYFSPVVPYIDGDRAGFVVNGYTRNTALCHHFACSWHTPDSPYYRERAGKDMLLLSELVALDEAKRGASTSKHLEPIKPLRILSRLFHASKHLVAKLKALIRDA